MTTGTPPREVAWVDERGRNLESGPLSRALDAADDEMSSRGHRLSSYSNEEYAAVLRPLLWSETSDLLTTDLDLSAIERAAVNTALDVVRDAVQALPSEPWQTQHDHPKSAGPVDRARVLSAIQEARPVKDPE